MSTSTIQREGSAFSRFMASGRGRVGRAAFGAAIAGTGLVAVGGNAGLLVATVGLVPIAAGVFNLCLIAPIWGGHFFGSNYCAPTKRTER
jgi:hypothetical protein